MLSWLDRGKTFAVYKKQVKNKIQNKQTKKQKNSNIFPRRSCQVVKHWDYLLWVEWALLSKGKDVKEPTCRVTEDRRKKIHRYDTPALKEALNPLFKVVEFLSLRNWTQTMFPWLSIESGVLSGLDQYRHLFFQDHQPWWMLHGTQHNRFCNPHRLYKSKSIWTFRPSGTIKIHCSA